MFPKLIINNGSTARKKKKGNFFSFERGKKKGMLNNSLIATV